MRFGSPGRMLTTQRMALRRMCVPPLAAAILLLPAWAQAIDHTPPAPEFATGYVVRVTLALFAVLVSIALAARLLRGFARFQTGTHSEFRILSVISMGPRERIVLLQVGETQLLVGVVPGRIQTLHVLERPIVVPSTPPNPSPVFSSILGAALKRGKAG
jgi:flagellar protein FliO/FliZ